MGRGLPLRSSPPGPGPSSASPSGSGEASYLPLVRESASAGAEALVVVDFAAAAQSIVREALDAGVYDQFVFADAAKRLSLIEAIGAERLGGMYGTAGAPAPGNEASAVWDASFAALFGVLPQTPYVKEAYDAAMALMLAAEAAGSVDGAAVRDQLRAIAGPPGQAVQATPSGVAEALRLLRAGEEIDYEGAASTLDWDANGGPAPRAHRRLAVHGGRRDRGRGGGGGRAVGLPARRGGKRLLPLSHLRDNRLYSHSTSYYEVI